MSLPLNEMFGMSVGSSSNISQLILRRRLLLRWWSPFFFLFSSFCLSFSASSAFHQQDWSHYSQHKIKALFIISHSNSKSCLVTKCGNISIPRNVTFAGEIALNYEFLFRKIECHILAVGVKHSKLKDCPCWVDLCCWLAAGWRRRQRRWWCCRSRS